MHGSGNYERTFSIRVQLADHHIGWVTDDSTCDTRNITSGEAHSGLLQAVVALLRLAELLVDELDGLFEGGELAHSVGDLTGPERVQALIQTGDPFLVYDLAPSFAQVLSVRGDGGLHAHLDGLERAQKHVGDKLGAGAGTEVYQGAVAVGKHVVTVLVLEDLVEAVFAHALERIPHKRGRPAEEDAADALFGIDGAPALEIRLVDARYHLTSGLDQIEWGDEGVRRTASHDAADHARYEVFGLVEGPQSVSLQSHENV